jgi:hypothetical protein
VVADGSGGLSITERGQRTSGSYTVDSDCIMELQIGMIGRGWESGSLVKLRGVLVDDGREILAVQSDPQRVAAARFRTRRP